MLGKYCHSPNASNQIDGKLRWNQHSLIVLICHSSKRVSILLRIAWQR